MNNIFGYLVITISTIAGSLSLLLFGVFLFSVPLTVIEFESSTTGILVWDALLCLIFFIQHSTMIRKAFRQRLETIVPRLYHGALFTMASAAALFALVLLWQDSGQTLLRLEGGSRWILHGVFFVSLIGLIWGMQVLRAFDIFGNQAILDHMGKSNVRDMPFTIQGPYRWVRHPAYFFILVMIWCRPDLSLDRLLFNLLFTGWITLGTYLEERDLVAEFGESYLDYQSKVPMLIPWKLNRPFSSGD